MMTELPTTAFIELCLKYIPLIFIGGVRFFRFDEKDFLLIIYLNIEY